ELRGLRRPTVGTHQQWNCGRRTELRVQDGPRIISKSVISEIAECPIACTEGELESAFGGCAHGTLKKLQSPMSAQNGRLPGPSERESNGRATHTRRDDATEDRSSIWIYPLGQTV